MIRLRSLRLLIVFSIYVLSALFVPGVARAVTGQDIFGLIQSGNLTGATQNLQSAIPSTAGINPGQISQIVQNLSQGNATGQLNPQAAIGLISGLMGGNVSGQLGQVLSGVANLGNVSGVQGIASLLTNPQIGSLFSQITGGGAGVQQATQLLGTIMGLASNPQSLAQIASNPASLIQSLLGNGQAGGLGGLGNMISQALGGGGSNGLGSALNGLGGAGGVGTPSAGTQTAAASSAGQAAAAGQQQQSTMNQNNQQITDNQQQGQPGTQSGPAADGSQGGCFIDNPTTNKNPLDTFGDGRGKASTGYAHQGVDIMLPLNSEQPGQPGCGVIMNGQSPLWGKKECTEGSGYGLYSMFDCAGVAKVLYAHLNGCNASTGKFIVGKTGNACHTDPHIHYELMLKDPDSGKFQRVDPACVWNKNKAGATVNPVTGIECPLPQPVNVCDENNRRKLLLDGKQKKGKVTSLPHTQGKPQPQAVTEAGQFCTGEGIPQDNTSGSDEADTPPSSDMGTVPGGDNPTETVDPKPELNESGAKDCCCPCTQPIIDDHNKRAGLHGMRPYFDQCDGQGRDCEKPANETEESALKTHRDWLVYTFFQKQILPAMMLMTNQMTTVAMTQVAMIGTMLDAKHQLETQRLFEELQARAHKDYHPSEGMCDIGTNVRALAASDFRADLMQTTLAQRMLSRGLITGAPLSSGGGVTDMASRLDAYIKNYCNKADNGMGLQKLCEGATAPKERMNKDVDFTRTLDVPLTINADFTKDDTSNQPDAEDIFALSANLFAHEVPPLVKRELLANDQGLVAREAGYKYLDLRSIMAKRSVAQNAFAAIAGMKASGGTEAAENGPFLKKLAVELGIPEADVEAYLGKAPSYFAQMEMLSKKIYLNPVFYNELYDKPANVDRKRAAIEAIDLMQDRDIYRSMLRSEAISAVILETMLMREHDKLKNEISGMTQGGVE